MKQQIRPQGLISLTSDQIEEALAKGFMRFVNSTARPYKTESTTIPAELLKKSKLEIHSQSSLIKDETGKKFKKNKTAKKLKKGHTQIRSQTGHDHDRNHQKY